MIVECTRNQLRRIALIPEEQTEQWCEFFLKRPHLLKVDASPTSTLGDRLFHTFTSEYRIAQRLPGEMMLQDADFVRGNVSDLFSIAELSNIKLHEYLAKASQTELEQVRTFPSPSLGEFTATPKKMITHAIVHSIRHWAQVSGALREHGQRPDFSHDPRFSKRLR
jgi:uncharacterized damage-inducible protein DinB